MGATLEVQPHARGAWLVRVGRRHLSVPPAMGRALLPLHGVVARRPAIAARLREAALGGAANWSDRDVARLAARLDQAGAARFTSRASPARPVWLRVPLVPEAVVRAAAGRLAWCASNSVLLGSAIAGAITYGAATTVTARGAAASPWLVAALFLATALWHELGHAAALAREGYQPGGIGAGLLIVIPVLYADVSAVAALPRAGRLRVDLAGVAFQLGAAGCLAGAAAWAPVAPAWAAACRLAAHLVLAAVAWSLLPFIRSDGYWALGDALGVAHLEYRAPPGSSPGRRAALGAYRLTNVVFLVTVAVWLPWRLAAGVGWLLACVGAPTTDPAWRMAALGLTAALTGLVWIGAVRRLRMLWRPPG